MEFYSVKHWEENFDDLFERVENGETIGIVNEKGEKAVMVPQITNLLNSIRN